VQAVQAYLEMRGPGPTDHVFLYRNQPLCKDLLHARIRACGERVGVKVYPHRLRHTCATQLLNAGCRVTSIQKFLGHKDLGTTMIYARVHNQTVADDYYQAMSQVEKRLELLRTPEKPQEPIPEEARERLLAFVEQLAQPDLDTAVRLEIAAQMRLLLLRREEAIPNDYDRKQQEHPPPSAVLLGVVSV